MPIQRRPALRSFAEPVTIVLVWDVFISHAAEDKDSIARPLADALTAAGFSVWYDDFTLRLGDGLRRSIDRGLSGARYGIVILSPAFFAKEWPQRELDGLMAREIASGKVILPIWHGVTRSDIERLSPLLADRLGVSTEKGLDAVVREIVRVLEDAPAPPVIGFPPAPTPPALPNSRRQWLAVVTLTGLGVATVTALQYRGRGGPSEPAPATPAPIPQTSASDSAMATPSKPAPAPTRTGLDGRWVVAATDRTPKTYFEFRVLDGRLGGHSEMLFSNHPDMVISGLYAQRRMALLEGQVSGRAGSQRVTFVTRRRYTRKLGDPSTMVDLVHRYDGGVEGEKILFDVQVEGGYFEQVTAVRVLPDR